MIKVNIVCTRVPGQAPDALLESEAYICPAMIDTVTPVSNALQHQVPKSCRAVVRYRCATFGYRLYYVRETAREVARARFRAMSGEFPEGPDFSDIPDGL